MAAAYALLDALGIPWHIVVDHQIAELEVDAFGGGFGGNHDAGLIAKVINEGCTFICRGRACNAICAFVPLQPASIDLGALGIAIRSVE